MNEPKDTPAPPPTLEQKRALVARHLRAMEATYRLEAEHSRVSARKADTYADFVAHRAAESGELDEESINLLLRDWRAATARRQAKIALDGMIRKVDHDLALDLFALGLAAPT